MKNAFGRECQSKVPSEAIELLPPPFDHYLGFLQGVENLSVEQFVA